MLTFFILCTNMHFLYMKLLVNEDQFIFHKQSAEPDTKDMVTRKWIIIKTSLNLYTYFYLKKKRQLSFNFN